MGEDSGEKTEEPTPHKLREGRKKGQIAKSKELTSAILMLIAFFTLRFYAFDMWSSFSELMKVTYLAIPNEFGMAQAGGMLNYAYKTFFKIVTPLFLTIFVAGVLLEAIQSGFLFSFGPLEPKLDNISPIQGFKKLFSLKQLVELFKSVIKMLFIAGILFFVIKNEFFIVIQAQIRDTWLIVIHAANLVIKVIIQTGIVYLILAVLDYFYQRYEFMKQMKMTKKEVKEEFKRLEGDPLIKQRQRESQRNMANSRQMGAVPGADVVVTNPVHYAVALKYDEALFHAPIIVAKGKELIATEIKRLATDYNVPIIENPPLARRLFKNSKVGQVIPEDSYKIVAEILAYVYKLKKKNAPKKPVAN